MVLWFPPVCRRVLVTTVECRWARVQDCVRSCRLGRFGRKRTKLNVLALPAEVRSALQKPALGLAAQSFGGVKEAESQIDYPRTSPEKQFTQDGEPLRPDGPARPKPPSQPDPHPERGGNR